MTSIRTRLFVILLLATSAVWLSAVVWIQHSTRTQVEHVLDRRLQESAQMVASLIARSGGMIAPDTAALVNQAPALGDVAHDFSRQLICQVWGFDGQLKSESLGAPGARIAGDTPGFSENRVEGEVWRVYSHVDPDLGIRVLVGDARSVRDGLVNDVALGLVLPALLILPLLAGLIWLAVRRGLAPLDQTADNLARRPATDFSPLAHGASPAELRPMIGALNDLFSRVETLRARERNFTAFAAHELKTPLAGLKTQAQIAAIAPDADTRQRALDQIATGVDRTDRMVRQLLDMTAAEHATVDAQNPPQDGADILHRVAHSLATLANMREVGLDIDAAPGAWATRDADLLAPALRNLLENAIHAAPPGTRVSAVMAPAGAGIRFSIRDRGPGIADSDRPHVTERFYRGAGHPSGGGSGLGLAIVAAVMARLGGELRLAPRAGGGEQADLILPG